MKEWLRNRDSYSDINLLNYLRVSEPSDFKNYLRMNDDIFNHLLDFVRPLITKQNTMMRHAVPAEQRLIAPLRFLATSRGFENLKFSCRMVSPRPETCRAIYKTNEP